MITIHVALKTCSGEGGLRGNILVSKSGVDSTVANAIGEFYALKSRHIHNLCLGAKGLTGRITSLESITLFDYSKLHVHRNLPILPMVPPDSAHLDLYVTCS